MSFDSGHLSEYFEDASCSTASLDVISKSPSKICEASAVSTSTVFQDFEQQAQYAADSIKKLESRASLLFDNVNSAKAIKDCSAALVIAREAIEQAKQIERKLAIALAADCKYDRKQRIHKQMLTQSLEAKIEEFNALSKKIDNAVKLEEPEMEDSHVIVFNTAQQPPTPPEAAPAFHFDSINTFEDSPDCVNGLRQVHSNIETTQQIFDELGSLVKQQQPFVNTLESVAAQTKSLTRGTVVELSQAHAARRLRTRRTWICAIILTAILCYLIFANRQPTPTTRLPKTFSK